MIRRFRLMNTILLNSVLKKCSDTRKVWATDDGPPVPPTKERIWGFIGKGSYTSNRLIIALNLEIKNVYLAVINFPIFSWWSYSPSLSGIGIVYESCSSSDQDKMVGSLLDTLLGSNKKEVNKVSNTVSASSFRHCVKKSDSRFSLWTIQHHCAPDIFRLKASFIVGTVPPNCIPFSSFPSERLLVLGVRVLKKLHLYNTHFFYWWLFV